MEIKKLKLYHFPATRSARVKWLLHELFDEQMFEVETVSLYEGAQYKEDFLARNPNHNVPMLDITFEDGAELTMLESGAMVTFLADAYPEKKLAPTQAQAIARADYLQMMYFGCSWVDMMLWQIRMQTHLLPEAERDPGTVNRYRDKFVSEAEPQLSQRLERHDYICGDEFCAVDCVMGQNVMWARAYGLCQSDVFKGYVSRFTKRPAFLRAYEDAGQFTLEAPR